MSELVHYFANIARAYLSGTVRVRGKAAETAWSFGASPFAMLTMRPIGPYRILLPPTIPNAYTLAAADVLRCSLVRISTAAASDTLPTIAQMDAALQTRGSSFKPGMGGQLILLDNSQNDFDWTINGSADVYAYPADAGAAASLSSFTIGAGKIGLGFVFWAQTDPITGFPAVPAVAYVGL